PAAGTSAVLASGFDFPLDVLRFGDTYLVSEAGAGRIVPVPAATPDRLGTPIAAGVRIPAGLAGDDGNAWVTDLARGTIVQIAARGRLLERARTIAWGLDRPTTLDVVGDELIVLESGAGRLRSIDIASGRSTVLATGLTPADPPLPGRPTDGVVAGISAADNRTIYVSDPLTNRVLRISRRHTPSPPSTTYVEVQS
ncbi:MAG: hypothetical protein ACRCY8_09730, partial [Dermatophilaceae bacterium]